MSEKRTVENWPVSAVSGGGVEVVAVAADAVVVAAVVAVVGVGS